MAAADLVRYRQEVGTGKRRAVQEAISRLLASHEAVTPARVAAEAGTGRTFIYEHPDLITAIREARAGQRTPSTEPASVRALRAENARLRERLSAERSIALDLRKQLRQACIAAIEDIPAADLAARIVDLEKRNSQLARRLREVENDRTDKIASAPADVTAWPSAGN